MSDDITLEVGGREFDGWLNVNTQRSMDALAGTFKFTHTDRWPGDGSRRPIRGQEDCRVRIGGDLVSTGVIYDPSPGFDANSHDISVSGRDRTGDLVDAGTPKAPTEWNNVGLARILADVCDPFGIAVAAVADDTPFKKFRRQPNETAFELLQRACRMKRLMLQTDAAGRISAMRADRPRRVQWALKEGPGGNIKSATGRYSFADRFSEYHVKGQQMGWDTASPGETNSPAGFAKDSGVKRYRPMVIVAEEPGDAATMQARAEWERDVRAARSKQATIVVEGFRDPDGDLWAVNTVVPVESPSLGIDHEMLVSGVEFAKSGEGSLANLTVMGVGAYAVEPWDPKKEIGW